MEYDNSFLGRQPKISPALAFILGIAFIPLGYAIQGSIGGGFEGAGIALIIMSIWDFGRLWIYCWRQARRKTNKD